MIGVSVHQENPLLKIENLSVNLPTIYGIVRILNGISFDLFSGKTIAIVGESGCGKSILCRSIMGLLPKRVIFGRNSRIMYSGKDLVGLCEKDYNQLRAMEIAMIFQDPLSSLNPVMKIVWQIAEVLICHKKMKPCNARSRAIDLLRSVGVPNPVLRADYYPHQLSGGMRQRVAIAISLACKPKILIADEPTTALDVTVQRGVLDLLGHLQVKSKMAMVLVTHDLRIAASRAHDIAVMYAGRIVEQAPAETLFNSMAMPYTKALTDSIPRMDTPPHTYLNSINGQPPNPLTTVPGCAFAPRCSRARKFCYTELPPLRPRPAKNHHSACWYPLKGSA